ncbi:Bifunctional inhibitor/lipid-transfer protein/seed storage 2S albumin protein [Dioscorea alata]|uniref:Bifunctional inhibitor/lipid-transfer protein/seed storage 2S albumin protein n=1 Tax=Dioscorea alata TaxID=55571 RepID=A0ACB7WFW2_DIOAL|nr:Bifunctional inhibitor/lipid-transfer protein/seed storage 2S albumin protein [Dioscorea alata]
MASSSCSCCLFRGLFLMMVVMMMCMGVVMSDDPLANKCSNDMQKLMGCMDYATGKNDKPSEGCCSSVTDIKGKEPVCLCFIIQQTHSGTQEVKSLGLQFGRLLQLPAACELANASLSECPKLLNLSPNSTDAAMFTNATKASTSTSSSTSAVPASSAGIIDHILLAVALVTVVASSMLLSIL